jgi:hypothetical protein
VTFSELSHKKVVGVPVLYLAAVGVVILAVVAWRMKPTPDSTPTDAASTPGQDAQVDENGLAVPGTSPYAGLSSNGTVTVVQQPSADADTTPTKPIDNEDWARKGAEWLTATHGVSGSAAIAALTKYISGTDRTFDEQTLVDMVIKEKGQPPNSIAEGGSVSAAPAKKQFSNFPGKHVIKGGSDNGFPQLATLYYGSAVDDRIDLLQAANPSLGTSGPWAVGTTVVIPAYHAPVYYTVTTGTGMTASQVAAKNGISLAQLGALNDPRGGIYKSTYWLKRGTTLRVK